AGLSDKALQDVTGLDDAMFCHNGLFIAGAKSFESTMKMAAMAVEEGS
ncbi:MAG: MYG1 family protein, partial [Mariprofundaceae bacterium]|nr:MYG1 family protein [Mariprofundaceae bacterium]